MATTRNSPQIGLEDEVLTDGRIIEQVVLMEQAIKAQDKVGAKALVKAVKDAQGTVNELLPPDDGKAHNYRVGQWRITQAPPGDERMTKVVPKNPTRRFKRVVGDDEGGESDG